MGSTLTLGALGCSVSTNTNIEELHLYIPDSLSDYPYDCLHRKDKKGKCTRLIICFKLVSSQNTESYYRNQTSLKGLFLITFRIKMRFFSISSAFDFKTRAFY